ncbi:DNA-binding transcriptional ArsR family regulator [Streptacidiphilus sp. MAP12-16]|uniref:helix-turn-helix domain-containing protein n=1 Tax=Streptacidiphilus sp. MAP12-16 TaxID=3156300 RepID=UPI003513B17C
MNDPQTATEARRPGVRVVDDIDTLKALADPLRVTMLRVMMDGTDQGFRAWTAKELATELGEPQTKLYRHLKQLEERGLIRVAETRLVSGIVEQRYMAAQTGLEFSRDFLHRDVSAGDSWPAFGAAIDSHVRRLRSAVGSGRVDVTARPEPAQAYRRPLIMLGDVRLPPDRAVEFRGRLAALISEFLEGPDTPDGVPLKVMISVYSEGSDGGEGSSEG